MKKERTSFRCLPFLFLEMSHTLVYWNVNFGPKKWNLDNRNSPWKPLYILYYLLYLLPENKVETSRCSNLEAETQVVSKSVRLELHSPTLQVENVHIPI